MDKSHIGAQEGYHKQNYDYDDAAGDIIEFARDGLIEEVPYAGELYDAATVISEMYGRWNDARDDKKWQVGFDWGQDESNDMTEQVSYWNKVDLELYEDQSLTVDIEDHVTCFPGDLVNQFDWTAYAPSISASGISDLSVSELNAAGIKKIQGSEFRQNPVKYGRAPADVADIRPNEIIYVATKNNRTD